MSKARTNPIGAVDPALAKLGFMRIVPTRKRRASMEVSGKTKAGKTRLVLSMPQPIGILNTDRSLEDLLPEFPGVDIIVKDFSDKFAPGAELEQREAKALESDFARAYRALQEHPKIKSIAITKWTTLWEVARYAEFGKASVKAHHYVPVNLRMRGYLASYQQYNKNLLLEQDVKEEWVGDKPTGRFIVDGFKYTPGMMQVNGFMYREEDGDRQFKLQITGCGLEASVVGWEFTDDEITWPDIMAMAVPDTTKADWR